MRLGLNMLHLVPEETGGSEVYARRLVGALLEERPGLRVTVFASREGAPSLRREPWASDAVIETVPVNARSRARRVLAEQVLLPPAARRAGIDLLHNVFTTAPAVPGVPQVTTILDVVYKRFPETHRGLLTQGMAVLTWLAARRSQRIITLSESAKADIVGLLGADPEAVDVAHLAAGLPDGLTPVPEDDLRRRFQLGTGPLVLTVSSKRAHKNLERLFDAFATVGPETGATLLVPGYRTDYERDLQAHAAESAAAGRIRFAGWLEDAALDGLYRMADCFVFPSLAEGFGIPVVEAMARGAPVACSNTSSLPEVAGDAALYFDPERTAAIADAIRRVLEDRALSETLRERGPQQARRFSWMTTARLTGESYDRALAAS